ncbi:MAG: hypothetical protein ACR2II_00410 [Chthoniobacterales bacterium]
MKTFLIAWLERLRTSYWFVPSTLAIGAVTLSFVTVHVDRENARRVGQKGSAHA